MIKIIGSCNNSYSKVMPQRILHFFSDGNRRCRMAFKCVRFIPRSIHIRTIVEFIDIILDENLVWLSNGSFAPTHFSVILLLVRFVNFVHELLQLIKLFVNCEHWAIKSTLEISFFIILQFRVMHDYRQS